MANAITLAKQFVPILDEVYKDASLTADLDGAADLVRAGSNANELVIPKLDMNGLADYSRNGGYVDGDVTLTNETVKCNFDRGRMFNVDTMDNMETAGIAFGRLAGRLPLCDLCGHHRHLQGLRGRGADHRRGRH